MPSWRYTCHPTSEESPLPSEMSCTHCWLLPTSIWTVPLLLLSLPAQWHDQCLYHLSLSSPSNYSSNHFDFHMRPFHSTLALPSFCFQIWGSSWLWWNNGVLLPQFLFFICASKLVPLVVILNLIPRVSISFGFIFMSYMTSDLWHKLVDQRINKKKKNHKYRVVQRNNHEYAWDYHETIQSSMPTINVVIYDSATSTTINVALECCLCLYCNFNSF